MRLTAAAVSAALVTGAACSDDVACPPADLRFTAPGLVELAPGGSVTVAWQADGDDAAAVELGFHALDRDTVVPLAPARLGDGVLAWDGRFLDGTPAPPAFYRVAGVIGRDAACPGTAVDGGTGRLAIVRGVRLPDVALGWRGSASNQLAVTTVNVSPLPVDYALDPDPLADGDEQIFAETVAAGELAPVPRTIAFRGTTLDGTPIAAGDYQLVAFVGTPPQRLAGTAVRWRPAE